MIKNKVQIEAWAPFGEGRNNMFNNPVLKKISDKYQKSVAQVILRWLTQRGVVALAKSVNLNRIQENFTIFDFKLSDDDMNTIKEYNKNKIENSGSNLGYLDFNINRDGTSNFDYVKKGRKSSDYSKLGEFEGDDE